MKSRIERVKWITEHLKKINMKREDNFRDPVVKNVVDIFVSRSDVGYE